MTTENQKADESVDQSVNPAIDHSKRSFAKKSAAIAPVVMTLANRSAWGANACIATGFQSYAAAIANGQVLSHAAPDFAATAGWKTPKSGEPTGTANGWADDANLSSWPNGVIPVRHRLSSPLNKFQRWGGTAWVDEQLSEANARLLGTVFVDQLLGGSVTTQTIYEALNLANSILAYEAATALNMRVKLLNLFPTLGTLADYRLFYSRCISYN